MEPTPNIEPVSPPVEATRPTIEDARALGRARIDKVLNWIAPIMAPEKLVEIGKNAAQDKVDSATESLNRIKERAEVRAAEIRDGVVEKVTAARDRTVDRFNSIKDKTIYKATEISKRAAVLGLTPVAKAEAGWEKIYQLPARFETWRAGKAIDRATAAELKTQQISVNHAVEIAETRQGIQAERDELLARLRELRDLENSFVSQLQEQHKQELGEIKLSRDEAQETAEEHRQRAKEIREKAAGLNLIRRTVEGLKPSA
jgi:hypothetical protein